jgi:NitT/TauT family transport system ATP-binding protein
MGHVGRSRRVEQWLGSYDYPCATLPPQCGDGCWSLDDWNIGDNDGYSDEFPATETFSVGGMINDDTPAVDIRDVVLRFPQTNGEPLLVLDHLSLQVRKGEVVSLVGPSGCGKTTILKLIAGLLEPTNGNVFVAGCLAAIRRGHSGYIPQGYSLFPWLTVRGNIAAGLHYRNASNEVILQRVSELLSVTKLEESADTFPIALSGGMKQRVAIARALAVWPDVILMDEPFSALDFRARVEIQEYFSTLMERNPSTAIIVTHDIQEAVLLSDRVVVLSQRPCSVLGEIEVRIARPRPIVSRYSPDVVLMQEQIVSMSRPKMT